MFVVIFSQSAVVSGVIRLAGDRMESLPPLTAVECEGDSGHEQSEL